MKKTVNIKILLLLIQLSLILLPQISFGEEIHIKKNKDIFKNKSNIYLTKEEKKFLLSHPVITLGTDKTWEPFVIIEENGLITGYDADILAKVNQRTGANFQLKAGVWHKMQEMAKKREIDGLSTGERHKERKNYLNFSDVYISLQKMVLVSNINPNNINAKEDLKGKTIIIQRGNLSDEKIARKFTKSNIITTDTAADTIRSVISGKADAIFGNGATLYMSYQLHLPYLQMAFPLDDSLNLVFGVRKDWPEAISILNKGLATISDKERLKIQNKWFLLGQKFNKDENLITFTREEKTYLDNRGPIKMCVDPNWMPYERINKSGKHEGMIADYIKVMEKKIGKKIELVPTKSWSESLEFVKSRKCDILSAVSKTPKRIKYLGFSSSYLSFPSVIVTKNNVSFIENIEYILDKKFSAIKGYAVVELLTDRYPNIKIIEVENIETGLEKVVLGKVYGFIGALPSVSNHIQKNSMFDLKIAGKNDFSMNLSIAVRKDEQILLSVFQKAIGSITEEDRRGIYNKWISVKFEHSFDYSLLWKVLGGVVIIFILIFYWNRRLSLEIKRRRKIELSLKKSYENLKIAKTEAEIANKAKSEFLANMSHELRTPLNAVIGFSELLSSIIKDDKQKTYVQSIRVSGKSLLTLIDDILDLSKIEAGKLEIKPGIVNIKHLMNEMEQMFKNKIEKKGIKFLIEIGENIPDFLILDGNRIRQILLNLIGNAIKFTEKGYIKVEVKKLSLENEDKIDLMIFVKDSGIGINKQDINTIFDSFKQQDGLDTRKFGGTGLGLSICKKLVTAMGGAISVKSTNGKGTVFKINLKNVQVNYDDKIMFYQEENFNLENTNFEEATILVVDDMKSSREIMAEILPKVGLKVITAENGKIALDLILKNKINLIFMDIRMPLMDGIETSLKIKEDYKSKDIPIIALTASSEINKENFLNKGFNEYLGKPFKISELLRILSGFIENSAHKLVNKPVSTLGNLDIKKIIEPEKLIIILNDDILPACKSLKNVMIMSEIQAFGEKIKKIGKKYEIKAIIQYADHIIMNVDSFDTVGIVNQLDNLADEINLLNNNWTKHIS